MVEHLSDLPTVEPEVCIAEMREADDCEEQDKKRVVELALCFEGVVSQLVAERFIVDIGFVFPVMATSITAEDVDMAVRLIKKYSATYWNNGLLF